MRTQYAVIALTVGCLESALEGCTMLKDYLNDGWEIEREEIMQPSGTSVGIIIYILEREELI